MIKPSIATLAAVSVIALGTAVWLGAHDSHHRRPKPIVPYPKATPPPPPSPDFTPAAEPAPTAEEIEREAREHVDVLMGNVERALAARDPQRREVVFTFLVPELVQVAPQRLVELVQREEPGEARDTLRGELARQWISRDRDAAVGWMKSLGDQERRAAAMEAVRVLADIAPDQAISVADELGVGRDDGFLERLVQGWSEDNLPEVDRWLATQPEGSRKAQLRARAEIVRERKKAG